MWQVLVADSFEGIPMPRTPQGEAKDETKAWKGEERYVSSRQRVESTFRRYGLLDDRVGFLPGFFNVSLPLAKQRGELQHGELCNYGH